MNETTPILPIHITLAPLSLFKWQLYAAQTAKKTWFNQLMATSMLPSENENDEEQDTIKVKLMIWSTKVLLLFEF